MSILNVGVLASGRGSNLQSIIDACIAGQIPARVTVVVSDNPNAYALERTRRADIPAVHVGIDDFDTREEYERQIIHHLTANNVGLVCLAGYMRLVGSELLQAFPRRILNIHPALLPAFPGLHAQEQAWNYGVKHSGCTVHFVDEGMDTGPIIIQATVPVLEEDTADKLAERILTQEHRIYPEAVRLFAEGKLTLEGRRVRIKE